MESKRLNVLYQFDNKYAPYAGVSVTSLLENNKEFDQICIYILGNGVSEENKALFIKTAQNYQGCEIKVVETETLIEQMKLWDMPSYRGSYAANLRLFFDYLIKDNIDRLVYLDSDTVITGSLLDLVETDIGDKVLGMVIDSIGRKHKKRIGLRNAEYYYNSGMILYDVKKWREQACSERIVEHVKNVRSHYGAPDQDLLNIVLKGMIFPLPTSYNYHPVYSLLTDEQYLRIFKEEGFYSKQEMQKAREDVRIYHTYRFLGEFPWHKGNCHPNNDLFDRYLEKSLWRDYVKQEAKTGMVMKLEKILFRLLPNTVFFRIFRTVYDSVDFVQDYRLKKST